MNRNELTPDELDVLGQIVRRNYLGESVKTLRVLAALERLCLIECQGERWVAKPGAESLVSFQPTVLA
jgi:hypothetical protein